MFHWIEPKDEVIKRIDLLIVQKIMDASGGWSQIHDLIVYENGDEDCVGWFTTVRSFQDYLELLEDGYKEEV